MAVTTSAIMHEHLDKIIHHAKEIALLEERADLAEKLAVTWKQQALRAEQKLADQVDWHLFSQHNYEADKAEQCREGEYRWVTLTAACHEEQIPRRDCIV
jgi:hypothetical protein